MPINRTYVQAHAQRCSHLKTPTDVDEENQVVTEKTKENTCLMMVSQETCQLHNSFVCSAKHIIKHGPSDVIGIYRFSCTVCHYIPIASREPCCRVSRA